MMRLDGQRKGEVRGRSSKKDQRKEVKGRGTKEGGQRKKDGQGEEGQREEGQGEEGQREEGQREEGQREEWPSLRRFVPQGNVWRRMLMVAAAQAQARMGGGRRV